MNISNNKRKKESCEKIEKTFVVLLQTKDIKEISVSDICKIAKINRSTFYANYIDIYDLVDKVRIRIINDFMEVYKDEFNSKTHSYNFLKLFNHIKDNQLFYKTYFKLEFDLTNPFFYKIDEDEILKHFENTTNNDYHIEFFKAGITAIIKKWLNNNCKESPEEINEIIKNEYKSRVIN